MRLVAARQGEYGEILDMAHYDLHGERENMGIPEYLFFSSSSAKLTIVDTATRYQWLVFGQTAVIEHIRIAGNLLFTVSQDAINIYRIGEAPSGQGHGPDNGQLLAEIFGQENIGSVIETHADCPLQLRCIVTIKIANGEQVNAVDVSVIDSRALMVYSQERKIKLIELTKILSRATRLSDDGCSRMEIEAADVQQEVTAHLDSINDLRIDVRDQMVISVSADKSIGFWKYNKQYKNQDLAVGRDKITIFDIFTNKVNHKFDIAIEKTNNYLYQVEELQNQARRTIWHVAVSVHSKLIAVSCGDMKVRIYQIKNDVVKQVKTLSDFNFQVVKSYFTNKAQELCCLQQNGVLRVVNVNNSEVECVLDISTLIKREISGFWFLRNQQAFDSKKVEENDAAYEFGCYSLHVYADKCIYCGSSTGEIYYIYDNTIEVEEQKVEQRRELLQAEQQFLLCLQEKDYNGALLVALQQKNERQALRLFNKLHSANVYEIEIKELDIDQIQECVRYVSNWVRQAKRCQAGIELLEAVLRYAGAEYLQQCGCGTDLKEIGRHLARELARLDTAREQCLLLDWFE